MSSLVYRLTAAAIVVLALGQPLMAQLEFEGPPIDYGKRFTSDRVAEFGAKLAAGEIKLESDGRQGYLASILQALDVPAESQTLVFSKTSFQLQKISAGRPRAVYFNDDTYVGWVQGSDVIELGSTDREQGAVFYTLEPDKHGQPRVMRDQGQCLICHGSSRTQGVPGYLIRSVYSTPAGRFVSGSPTYVTDHTSPFAERWGGWYVTGQHGSMRHLGNVLCTDENKPGWIDVEEGDNLLELPSRVRPTSYLRPTSDIVALMVMEHQTQMHNLMTRCSYEARTAAYQDRGINEALDRPLDHESDSTGRRIASVSEKLLRYMLMAEEFELTSPVEGNSGFAEKFSERGPKDSQGRSFYQLDLQKGLFKYPCSFLVHSTQFDALPLRIKQYLGKRLGEILRAEEPGVKGYERLKAADRQAIAEILAETKPQFWQEFCQ